ncbi:hypothetical protein BDV19DRAFT_333457 [Aspergillus venezuelensis]
MPSSKSRHSAPGGSDIATNEAQKRRKNVGTACSNCKSRKLKCTGAPPCANCLKSNLDCTLDETADKRRRGVLKRKIDKYQDKEDLLVRLLAFFRERSHSSTAPLVNLIRNNASPAEIRFYIEHQLPRSDFAQTTKLLEDYQEIKEHDFSEPQPKRRMLDIDRTPRVEAFSVPAQPWTSVIVDNELVSRLIYLWFKWAHPVCNFIDRELFIRDMKSGSLSASYCSPLLVNVILADACAYTDYSAVGFPDNLFFKRSDFYEEAKRLLDKEEGHISLPTVQGLGVLWMCSCLTGRDRQAWIRGSQLAYSLRELSQASANTPAEPVTDSDAICMARTVNHAHWGMFNLAMINAIWHKKTPIIRPPSERPSSSADPQHFGNNVWYPYPNLSGDFTAHTASIHNATCDVNRIAYDLAPIFSVELRGPYQTRLEPKHETLDALQKLAEWPDRLLDNLKENNVDVPYGLTLHMHYHTIIMAVYKVLRSQPIIISDPSRLDRKTREAISSPVAASNVAVASARNIAQLSLVHRANWGSEHMPPVNVPCIMAAMYTLLDKDVLEDPANRDAFIALTAAAKTLSRRWEFTKAILRRLPDIARQRGITLPSETHQFFLDTDHLLENGTPGKSESPEYSQSMTPL